MSSAAAPPQPRQASRPGKHRVAARVTEARGPRLNQPASAGTGSHSQPSIARVTAVPITEGDLQAARATAAYRAAIWILRLSTVLLPAYLVSLFGGALHDSPALDAGLLA